MIVAYLQDHQRQLWADYVEKHPHGSLYHLPQWKNCIERAYGHKTYYLMAIETRDPETAEQLCASIASNDMPSTPAIRGVLPLVHIKHFLFGNSLISMPFCDLGGILADDESTEAILLSKAIELGCRVRAGRIEFRHARPLQCLEKLVSDKTDAFKFKTPSSPPVNFATFSDKARLLLPLPNSSEELMKSFRSKLRSQIRRALKHGLISRIGGSELLNDFYDVFVVNMRDLGSPVHSRTLLASLLEEFSPKSRIVAVYKDGKPLAASVVVGFNDTLANPWASSLREYSNLSPNMLLYWSMLEYACDNRYARFDFGRSSLHESTYKFKVQWGAEPHTLYWHYVALDGVAIANGQSEKAAFKTAIEYWKKLPVPLTRLLGPVVRRYIGL